MIYYLAGWQKGALTMKDDVKESKKYFEKVNLNLTKGQQVGE